MDVLLIPYFENINDGGEQGDYLKEFGDNSVQKGICFHLTLTWMYLYKLKHHQVAPNEIWTDMKNPTMISQIANNQRAYIDPTGDTDIHNNLQYYNLQGGQVNIGDYWDDIVIANEINVPVLNSAMKLIIFQLFDKNGKRVGGHAIGTILHEDKIYLYDPNVGVMTAPNANSVELLDKIRYIYEYKGKLIIRNVDLYHVR